MAVAGNIPGILGIVSAGCGIVAAFLLMRAQHIRGRTENAADGLELLKALKRVVRDLKIEKIKDANAARRLEHIAAFVLLLSFLFLLIHSILSLS